MFRIHQKVVCINGDNWKVIGGNIPSPSDDTSRGYNDPVTGEILKIEDIEYREDGLVYLGFYEKPYDVYWERRFAPLEEKGDITVEEILEESYIRNA